MTMASMYLESRAMPAIDQGMVKDNPRLFHLKLLPISSSACHSVSKRWLATGAAEERKNSVMMSVWETRFPELCCMFPGSPWRPSVTCVPTHTAYQYGVVLDL